MNQTCTVCKKLRFWLTLAALIAVLVASMHSAEATQAPDVATNTGSASEVSHSMVTAKPVADSVNGSYLLQLIAGLSVVLVSIIVLAWFAKRFNRFQSSSDGSLQVLGGISMGARERVVLIQVGGEQLVLGVAPGNIRTLHVIENSVANSNANAINTPVNPTVSRTTKSFGHYFADKLQSALIISKTEKNASVTNKKTLRRNLRSGLHE